MITNVLLVLQLLPSDVKTVYVPATKPAMLEAVVFDGNQVYVYTPLPPKAVTLAVPLLPPKQLTLLVVVVANTNVGSPIAALVLALAKHPLNEVTFTV